MGDPLSPILCEFYMQNFESLLFNTLQFKAWFRYVDDTFVLFDGPKEEIPNILQTLNSIDPCIQFTAEIEVNNEISFLDVLIRRDLVFSTKVFRKECTILRPPHSSSSHPFSQKMSAMYSFVLRAINLCSEQSSLLDELNFLKSMASDRGFNPSVIDKAVKKLTRNKPVSTLTRFSSYRTVPTITLPFFGRLSTKFANVLKQFSFQVVYRPVNKLQFIPTKDPVPASRHWGVYRIPCECGLEYIGQTRRALQVRVSEHKRYVKYQQLEKSAIAKHVWAHDHRFLFDEASVFITTHSVLELDFLESTAIMKNSHQLVNDLSSTPPLSSAWKSLL